MYEQTPSRQVAALQQFRAGFYACLHPWGDTLFELTDALLRSPTPVTSLPMLSLEPAFRRQHASLYRSLADGRIDVAAFADLLAAASPADWPQVYAVDVSTYPRPDAVTSAEREFCHVPVVGGHGIVPGYAFSLVSRLSFAPGSWTAPVDIRRLHPDWSRQDETIAQLWDVIGRQAPGSALLFVFDAGYNSVAIAAGLAGSDASTLTRLRADRWLYREPAPPVPGQPRPVGRPRVHGELLRCGTLERLPTPDERLTTTGPEGTVVVSAWHQLHFRPRRATATPRVRGSLLTVQIIRPPRADGTQGRELAPWRLFWTGPGTPDLDLVWRAYYHRFDIEHTFRFDKRTLGWTVPSLATPEQAERWTLLLTAVYTQLRLARGLVADERLPWQRPVDPDHLSPGRVRQGFARVAYTLGSPTTTPKLVKPGLGWAKGRSRARKPSFPVVKRGPPQA